VIDISRIMIRASGKGKNGRGKQRKTSPSQNSQPSPYGGRVGDTSQTLV